MTVKNRTTSVDLSGSQLKKWVINRSDRMLTDTETRLLAKGLNFAVAPKILPVEDIIVQTELACRNLDNTEAADMRAEIVGAIKSSKPPTDNISREERRALLDLKKDKSIMILAADKGRATVVLNRTDYEHKIQQLLNDDNTYEKLKRDPTAAYKRKLTKCLLRLQKEGKLSRSQYAQLYPTAETPPKLYGLPKIHKEGTPLRPIVSSIGSITYQTAKFLAKILNPLVGKSCHHVLNSKDFVDKVKDIILGPHEALVSYDVSALFTSVPVDDALKVISSRLTLDPTLNGRTNLSVEDITELLDIVLNTTYFIYKGEFHKQKHGAAMGSPISPIVANLYMENFEEALGSIPNPLRLRLRCVDGTFTICHRDHITAITDFINSQDRNIKFTRELDENHSVAFLDSSITHESDGYRKVTHTNQYFNF
ncbi:uncharacterized protein LOC106151709 [Lingula anatina]|uniref:Uncharacterized protein LOC106151709 n=1 Tax=Lingula anatina TaxID=7574 RepID=A0A1S3H3F9_LINAN|nr:uncharacterized protein LOC106151709 [Lingula anatina]|eukprot:XP_013380543.1 uncharacterized protein LOC106151709 [Lingula anatina]